MPKFGHKHKLISDSSIILKRIKNDPRFKVRLAKISTTPIIKKYDIPYLCGYAKNAKHVYFDRHLNLNWKGHDLSNFLRIHELAEKAILDIFKFKYPKAHHFASYFERVAVEDAGLDWDEYQRHLKPYIKNISKENLTIVPRDLDLEPYIDEKDKKLMRELSALDKREKSLKEHLNII